MYYMVLDTETTDINKCFCYNVGYLIFDDMSGEIVKEREFVVEQIWHNLELFQTAYYAEKRPLYIDAMRKRKATLDKWGYIMQEMIRDIRRYHITDAYAYNAPFDDKVFTFNCDWFKTKNPLDTIAMHDIWGYACEVLSSTAEYKLFCETNNRFTESGNYSGNAETAYQFITGNKDFTEMHMGLADCKIEYAILLHCVKNLGLAWNTDYKVVKVLNRVVPHPYSISVNGTVIHSGEYIKKYNRNDTYKFTELNDDETGA